MKIYNIQKSSFTGYSTETIEITDVRNIGQGQRIQESGWNVYYGRRIEDGMYTIGGQTYVLRNNGETQTWFILNADNTQTKVDVEQYKSSNVYYYRFGSTWFKYINNNFVYYGATPPFYMSSSAPSVVNYAVSASASQSASSSQTVTYSNNYLMPMGTKYTVAAQQAPVSVSSSSSSNSGSSMSYQIYRPVDQVTLVEVAKPAVVSEPVVASSNTSKMVKSQSIFGTQDSDKTNSDASLFGSW